MIMNDKSQEKRVNSIETYMSEFSAVRHEGVGGCEFAGISSVTYAEISKDAFMKYYQDSLLELRNVEYLSPLVVEIKNPQEIRTIIKKESDHLKFIISSRTEQEGAEESLQWIKHAEGSMYKLVESETPQFTLKDLKDKCDSDKKTKEINAVTGISGPVRVWDCIAHTYTGEGEALIELDTPDEVIEELKGHILHPCLTDCIIDTAIKQFAGNGLKSISCENMKFYGVITSKTYAYIRKSNKKANNIKEVGYHITLFDESGNRISEIRNYIIRYGQAEENTEDKEIKIEKSKPHKDIGYATAKHGRPVEDISKQNKTSLFISELSWRQMNCRDRIIAFLLSHKNEALVNYFKFFIGAKRGYKLKETEIAQPGDWIEEVFHNRILNRFGYSVNVTRVDKPEDIHDRISNFIDKGKPVGFWMDEYHIFYTPFYHKSHTGHIAAINGYNKDNRLYSIIDHNHLRINNPSQFIDYGQFYCTYEVLENIYSGMRSEYQFVITLDETSEGNLPKMEDLQRQIISILKYLADSGQAGNDSWTIYNSSNKGDNFDTGSVDDLYVQLGGKELMLDTVLNYFCCEQERKSLVKELSYKIIQKSNMLVDNYITGLYRGKGIPRDKTLDYIQTIQGDSVQLFREILKQYSEDK